MSLIINTLNKVKKENDKKYVPPHLVIEKEKSFLQKIRFPLLLIIFFVSVGFSFYFLFLNETIVKNFSSVSVKQTTSEKKPVDLQEYGLVLTEEEVPETKELKKKPIKKQEIKKVVEVPTKVVKIKKIPRVVNTPKVKEKKIVKETSEKTVASNFEIITPEKREKIFNKYLLMADKFYLDGKNEKAIEYYEKALYLKNDTSVLNVLLNLYIQEGKVNQVVKTLTESKLVFQNEDVISGLIIEMIDKGYFKEANQILSKLLNEDKNGYFLYAKGYLEEKRNNIKDALYFYEKAFEKNKVDPFISYAYGKLEEKNKNYQKALQIYKNIIEKNPNHRLSKKLETKLQKLTQF